VQKVLFLIGLVIFISSCEGDKNEEKIAKIASVNAAVLSQKELTEAIPNGLNKEDSLSFVDQYIENWTREQVILQKAEEVLSEEGKNVAERLEKYRKSLLIYSYEQAYLEDRLDTIITEEEIKEYYDNHKKDFTLKGYIVKGYFGQFKNAIDIKDLKSWYRLKSDEDYINTLSFSQINAIDYQLDTTKWIYFDKVLEKIPLENNIHKNSFIKYKKNIDFEEDGIYYFVNITDSKLEDELSPLVFEKEKIKSIILNQRTQKTIKKLNDELYKDAMKQQQIIIHTKK